MVNGKLATAHPLPLIDRERQAWAKGGKTSKEKLSKLPEAGKVYQVYSPFSDYHYCIGRCVDVTQTVDHIYATLLIPEEQIAQAILRGSRFLCRPHRQWLYHFELEECEA